MTSPAISSSQNPRARYARKLSRRSFRDSERAYLLEGPVVVAEALRSGAPVSQILIEPSCDGLSVITTLAAAAGIQLTNVDDHVMRSLSGTATPQGVVAVCAMTDVQPDELPADMSLVLVLAEIQDPGNAGTLVRSAVAAGADAVVFSQASVDPYSAKTVRSSAGLVCRSTLVRQAPLSDIWGALKERNIRVVGADAEGEVAYDDIDLTVPTALVLGNEAGGLPEPPDGGSFDSVVKIPMPGPAESLNVAAAGSVMLFEAVRQRRLGSSKKMNESSTDGDRA